MLHKVLIGKKVLVTAGPTHEPIDPVRFISNHSSGKMGYALVSELIKQGAKVILISGPTNLKVPQGVYEFIAVQSAADMYSQCLKYFPEVQLTILAAAVADYTPVQLANQKIKSKSDKLTIELKKTKDIAFELGAIKKSQLMVGFALETENELENAFKKLQRKNLDLIVLNSLKDKGAGFGHDTNKVTILDANNKTLNFGLKDKTSVAMDIIEVIVKKLASDEAN